MKYRRLGRTELDLSEIAFGTGDNGGGIVYGSPPHQRALVARALELGVNTFDCSPDYGKGLGEANLGRVLRELGADPIVMTKVEIMPEEFGRMGEKVRESVRDSLMRLGRDHVDVFMLHNPIRHAREPQIRQWTPLTPADVLDDILPAMIGLRDAGVVRHLGLACEAAEPSAVRSVVASRRVLRDLINVRGSILQTRRRRRRSRGCASATATTAFRLFELPLKKYELGVAVIRPLARRCAHRTDPRTQSRPGGTISRAATCATSRRRSSPSSSAAAASRFCTVPNRQSRRPPSALSYPRRPSPRSSADIRMPPNWKRRCAPSTVARSAGSSRRTRSCREGAVFAAGFLGGGRLTPSGPGKSLTAGVEIWTWTRWSGAMTRDRRGAAAPLPPMVREFGTSRGGNRQV